MILEIRDKIDQITLKYKNDEDETIESVKGYFSSLVDIVISNDLVIDILNSYLTTICIPLSFLICNRRKRQLIYHIIPLKIRNQIQSILSSLYVNLFGKDSAKTQVRAISIVNIRSSSNK